MKERNREYCLKVLTDHTKTDSLLKHAFAVEACLMHYAKLYNEDEAYWGNIGLLHDFDYEMYPTYEDHTYRGNEILEKLDFEKEFRESIMSHASYTNIPRDTLLKKVLFASDELAGFILAVVYVRPSKSIDEVEVKSVKKRMKDKAFAKAVSREEIQEGAEAMGITLDEHIQNCIDGMKARKELLGV